jgi:P27 family predicted phage terminase small subunit
VVKNAEGNRSHATKDKTTEKIVGVGALAVPDHLTEDEQRLWALTVHSLPKGLLCRADTSILERYVVAWARYRECDKTIKDEGMTVKSAQGYYRHPLMTVMRDMATEMHSCGSELGLSPVARERLSAATLKDDDPMGWLLDGGDDEG